MHILRKIYIDNFYVLCCGSLLYGGERKYKAKVLPINYLVWFVDRLREVAKYVFLLMAGPLRPKLPPPLELNGRWKNGTLEKKVPKKVILSIIYPLQPPPTLLMTLPLREELFLQLP